MADDGAVTRDLLDSPLDNGKPPGVNKTRLAAVLAGLFAAAAISVIAAALLRGSDDPIGEPTSTTEAVPTTIVPSLPEPRMHARLAFDPVARSVVLLGGQTILDGRFVPLADAAWRLDVDRLEWKPLAGESLPKTVAGAAAAYVDPSFGIALFGGSEGTIHERCFAARSAPLFCTDAPTGDLWRIDVGGAAASRVERTGSGPDPRSGHAMAYDSGAGRLVLFGGLSHPVLPDHGAGQYLRDTWLYDLDTNEWEHIDSDVSPAPRAWHTMAYADTTGLIYLFGGLGASALGADPTLWAFDTETRSWHMVAAATDDGPGARWHHSMVFDPTTGWLVAAGGIDRRGASRCPGDAWRFEMDSQRWRLHEALGPQPCLLSMTTVADGVVFLSAAGGMGLRDLRTGEWLITWHFGP